MFAALILQQAEFFHCGRNGFTFGHGCGGHFGSHRGDPCLKIADSVAGSESLLDPKLHAGNNRAVPVSSGKEIEHRSILKLTSTLRFAAGRPLCVLPGLDKAVPEQNSVTLVNHRSPSLPEVVTDCSIPQIPRRLQDPRAFGTSHAYPSANLGVRQAGVRDDIASHAAHSLIERVEA
jgi:hypothetical protein